MADQPDPEIAKKLAEVLQPLLFTIAQHHNKTDLKNFKAAIIMLIQYAYWARQFKHHFEHVVLTDEDLLRLHKTLEKDKQQQRVKRLQKKTEGAS